MTGLPRLHRPGDAPMLLLTLVFVEEAQKLATGEIVVPRSPA